MGVHIPDPCTMIYLFIHQNFPGQYQHLARYLAEQSQLVYFITQPTAYTITGVRKLIYRPEHGVRPTGHPYLVDIDAAVHLGLAVAKICRQLRDNGVIPDIVIGHHGWGETLFVKDVFPDVPLLGYLEFYYSSSGVDVGFDPEFPVPSDNNYRLRMRNMLNQMHFGIADWGHTATKWQRSLYPPIIQPRITALHEGVDTRLLTPETNARLRLPGNGLVLTRSDEVITYVARNLEPYRGFHRFMRALPELQARRPDVQVVIVGGDGVSYGQPPPNGKTYREMLLAELAGRIDLSRVHFLGHIPYDAYRRLLQVSSVHVYLTYPFVLSWSLIEALASGCVVIGSGTPPVREVVSDRQNGLLVDFFQPGELCDRIDEVLDHPDRMAKLRIAARDTALERYDLQRLLPRWMSLIERLIRREAI